MIRQTDPITYEVGGTYEFTVHTLHDNLCDLVDAAGLHVYLKHTARLHLTKGQTLRCCITGMGQNRPKVELDKAEYLAVSNSRVNEASVTSLLNEVRGDWDGDGFAALLLMDEVEDLTYASACRQWIGGCIEGGADLQTVRRAVVGFMEETNFLGLCTPAERDTYQQRLTETVDALDASIRTRTMLGEGTATQFVDRLLDRLDKAGYVYQPEVNFRLLSSLFLADSSLAADNVGRLFDVVRRWPLDIWKKPPFADALLNILQLYVDENIDRVGRTSDNGRMVRNLLQALSILLLLADRTADANGLLTDERIVRSRLCVIASYVDNYKNQGLLNAAAGSLLADGLANFNYSLADTSGNHIAFALKCTPAATSEAWPVTTASCYISGPLRLRVDADGITIETDSPKAKTVLDHVNLWGNLQVMAERKNMPSLSGELTVKDCKRLWEAIEHELFVPAQSVQLPVSPRPAATKTIHVVGDKVVVWVKRVADNVGDDTILYCCFEGEQKESGYLYIHDVVGYVRNVSLRMFQDDLGKPLLLEAKIIGEDVGGLYQFSMLESLKAYATDKTPGDRIICSLGMARKAGVTGYTPGISLDGASVSLVGDFPEDLQRGDLVSATYMNVADGTFHLQCSIDGRVDGEKVDPLHLFHKLITDYAYTDGNVPDVADQQEEENADNVDLDAAENLLDAAYVRELVRILDRLAAIDADYVKSYNYIAYARVLCLMLPDGEAQADYYRGRKQLIEMLYDFAVNDTVDTTQLDRLQYGDGALFNDDTPMRDKLQQLRIISYMGFQTHDDDLQSLRSTTQGLTREMASLAMAYNILRENAMQQQANDVLNRIKNALRLNGYESHLKTYGGGIESQTVEFKTSIVYPPENGSYPDHERQMNTILTVIAAFLNTDGGTLYIGVNDSGAGVGVYDDLCYKDFNGDRDKYQRAVLDGVALKWGNNVASYVSARWDTDANSGKDVLVVTVLPYEAGVQINGEWVYRNGSGNRHLTKAEFEDYNERRRARKADDISNADTPVVVPPTDQQDGADNSQKEDGEQTETPGTSTSGHEQEKTEHNGTDGDVTDDDTPEENETAVRTSSRRNNVLASYETGYIAYDACLKFIADGKFEKLPDFDYDYDSELTLPVYDEDARDHYLLLGYEDFTIGKVPIRELLRFDDYKSYQRYNGSRLIFAAIAANDEGVVSVTRENKNGGRMMVRVDTIGNIEEGRLPDRGQRVANEGIAECALGYEIASASEMEQLGSLVDRDARTLGLPVATLSSELKDALRLPKVAGISKR